MILANFRMDHGYILIIMETLSLVSKQYEEKKMCFMSDGIQVKGKSALGNDGKYHYYDANSGIRLS
ncbi:hypothetical protein [Lentilactobacillus kisonensis]|nr:hypothetical protein [Lentilactobacillus kisonensis]